MSLRELEKALDIKYKTFNNLPKDCSDWEYEEARSALKVAEVEYDLLSRYSKG